MSVTYARITRSAPAGFFSNFFWALSHSIEADNQGYVPVLDFPVEKPSRGWGKTTQRRWSDYFDVIDDSTLVVTNKTEFANFKEAYIPANQPISILHSSYKKLMPLQPSIERVFDAAVNSFFGSSNGRVLGVHYRGKDMFWYPSHPTPPTKSQIAEVTKGVLSGGAYNSVFVATDTPSFASYLKGRVGVPVISTEDFLTTNTLGLSGDSVKRVLVDAYCLALTDGLIHSSSNVSHAARVFRGVDYDERVEIDLGRNPRTLASAVAKSAFRRSLPRRLSSELLTKKTTGVPATDLRLDNHDPNEIGNNQKG